METSDMIVAIGSRSWNDSLQNERGRTSVIRTLAPTSGRRFTVDQLYIEPDLPGQVDPREFEMIRLWVRMSVAHKFGPDETQRAQQVLAAYGLIDAPETV